MSNLYVSNGMAAGNTLEEARTQALSEILERHVKYSVVSENLCLPDVPQWRLENFPSIAADIAALRQAGPKFYQRCFLGWSVSGSLRCLASPRGSRAVL